MLVMFTVDFNDAANGILAGVTVLILLANLHLAKSTKRTADAAGEQASAATKQADAASEQASAMREQLDLVKRQLEEARRQVDISEKTLAAQFQPVLIDEPLDLSWEDRFDFPTGPLTIHPGGIVVTTSDEEGRISFPVRNKGRGAAHIVGIAVRLVDREGTRIQGPPCNEITRHVVPVDESTRLNFWFTPSDLGPRWDAWRFTVDSYANFSILVRYRDLAGHPDLITHFIVQKRDRTHYGWEPREIFVQAAAEVVEEEHQYYADLTKRQASP